MRKILLALVFLASAAFAQNPGVVIVGTAPSGTCVPGSAGRLVNSTGVLWLPVVTGGVCTWTASPTSGGGTTTNALTGAASGGAAPGTTFNGSAARTFDYSTFGAANFPTGNGIPTVNTAGTAWGPTLPQVPVENYGAVGYTTQAAAVAGTDSTSAVNACITALTAGQCTFQALYYKVAGAISITKSNVGLSGVSPSFAGVSSAIAGGGTTLVATAQVTTISVAGSDASHTVDATRLDHFTIKRSTAATGTATDISLNFALETQVDSVLAEDAVYPFHIHGSGSGASGYIQHSGALWGYGNPCPSTANMYGFFLDSEDGTANPSMLMLNNLAVSACGGTPVAYGVYSHGTSINDLVNYTQQESGLDFGIWVECAGCSPTMGLPPASDIQFVQPSIDGTISTGTAMTLKNVAGVTVTGGLLNGGVCSLDIEGSSGVVVHGVHFFTNSGTVKSACINGSKLVSLTGNMAVRKGVAAIFNLSGSSAVTVQDNNFEIAAAGDPCCFTVQVVGGSNNVIGPNVYDGPGTNLYSIDSTTSHNTVQANMAVADASTTDTVLLQIPPMAIGSLPTASTYPAGTQIVVTDALTFTPGTCTNGGSDTMIAITNHSTWSCH